MPLNSSREAPSAYFCRYHSPLGEITLAADEHYLTGLWFVGQKYYAANHALPCVTEHRLPVFTQIRDWLDAYFSGLALCRMIYLFSPGAPNSGSRSGAGCVKSLTANVSRTGQWRGMWRQ